MLSNSNDNRAAETKIAVIRSASTGAFDNTKVVTFKSLNTANLKSDKLRDLSVKKATEVKNDRKGRNTSSGFGDEISTSNESTTKGDAACR
jgi:hypothetical protein